MPLLLRLKKPLLLVALLACLVRVPTSSAQTDLVTTFAAIRPSLFLIQAKGTSGFCFGVGFVIDSSDLGSTLLTAAHVLNQNECGSNPMSQSDGQNLPASVSVYSPPSPIPLAESIQVPSTNVDVNRDLAIIQISTPNLPVTCLKAGAPRAGTHIGLAAFSVRTPNGKPDLTGPFTNFVNFTYPVVREGIVGGSNQDGTEYFAPVEFGFSGGPIFEARTGLVFAVTQKALQVQYKVSTATLVSIAGIEFSRFIAAHTKNISMVPNPATRYESIQHTVYPDMAAAGRLVLLRSVLDPPADSPNLIPVEGLLKQVITDEMQLSDLFDEDDVLLQDQLKKAKANLYPWLRDQLTTDYYRRLCATDHAVGLISARRSIMTVPSGESTVQYELSFKDCWGANFKTVMVPEIPLPGEDNFYFTHRDEWNQVDHGMRDALEHLGKNRSALRNFAMYGIPLADGERRMFMGLERQPDGSIRTKNVFTGGSAFLSGLREGVTINSFNGIPSANLTLMSDQALSDLISTAESKGDKIRIQRSDGITVGFSSANICGYLEAEAFGVKDHPRGPAAQ